MTAPALQFRVAGTPSTQGSKRGFAFTPKGGGKTRAVVVDNNPKTLKPWRDAVRSTATEAWGERPPIYGPVRVLILFALKKPGAAPKWRRIWPIGARSGDVDKLARAVLDALTDAGVWRDDSQVVRLEVVKDYPEHVDQLTPGAIVRLWTVEDRPPTPTTGPIPLQTTPEGS